MDPPSSGPQMSTLPGPDSQLPPRPRTPPHRRSPPKQPLKGILKPPPPPQAKFNFKRDILNPFSTRLGYAAIEESPLSAVVGSGSGSVGQGVQAAAGWVGSAFKRLGAVAVAEKAKLDDAMLHQSHPPITKPSSSPFGPTNPKPTRSPNEPPDPTSPNEPANTSLKNQPSLTRLSQVAPPSVTTSFPPSNMLPRHSTTAPHLPSSQSILSTTILKKVHFTMSDLKVIYPISNSQPPSFDHINKLRINQARRTLLANRLSRFNHQPQRITAETNSQASSPRLKNHSVNGWNAANLEVLYDECCKTREEGWGVVKIRQILKQSAPYPPEIIDLTGVQLNTVGLVEVLGDLLSVDFGLKSLVLENCALENDGLKPILHALLVSGSLPSLSLADNKKLRVKGWKMVAIFLKKAHALRHLDLSGNSFDKRSIEYLLQALAGPNRKDEYYAPKPILPLELAPESPVTHATHHAPSAINEPANAEPSSTNQPLPLVSAAASSGISPFAEEDQPLFPGAPLLREDPPSPAFQALSAISAIPKPGSSNLVSLRLDRCNLKLPHLDLIGHGIRLSKLKHISMRQNKIGNLGGVALAVMIRDWLTHSTATSAGGTSNSIEFGPDGGLPNSTSGLDYDAVPIRAPTRFESSNSVTARQTNLLDGPRLPLGHVAASTTTPLATPMETCTSLPQEISDNNVSSSSEDSTKDLPSDLVSMIQLEKRKANEQRVKLRSKIDSLPKTGQLLTLDVKSNDLKSADVFYLAQVLKKNRTLKVLNLAENKIDSVGLVHLSDALRFNTCLETLDVSKNPCCGTGLEGISALRTTCTINTTLKRLFLSQTELTSEGAIALAEFLPEMRSLIHLDLTENHSIDIAGVMALTVSVKMNTTLRCLDINIPPNDPDFARLSQDILQSCVRNTEFAQQQALERGNLTTISQPMLKSTVVRELTTRQQNSGIPGSPRLQSAELGPERHQPKSKSPSADKVIENVLGAAEATCNVLADLVREDERRKQHIQRERRAAVVECSELVRELLDQAKASRLQIEEALAAIKSDELRIRATGVSSILNTTLEYAEATYRRGTVVREDSHPAPRNSSRPLEPLGPSEITAKEAALESTSESSTPCPKSPKSVAPPIDPRSDESPQLVTTSDAQTSLHLDLSNLRYPLPTDKMMDGEEGNADDDESDEHVAHSPRSPVETHSRSLTLEEGEVFRKGTLLRTADADDEETQEVPGEILKESILVTEVKRNPRSSLDLTRGDLLTEDQQTPKEQSNETSHHGDTTDEEENP